MWFPQLVFDQKNNESWNWPVPGAIGIFFQSWKIEACAGVHVVLIIENWFLIKKSWKLKLACSQCGRDLLPVLKNWGACRCPSVPNNWFLIKNIMKVEIGALKLLYGTTNRCFIDTSGNSSKTKNKNACRQVSIYYWQHMFCGYEWGGVVKNNCGKT